jgi:hypothetical protein
MPTLLQLQKAKATAAAKVEDARKALAVAKTDAEISKHTAALATALAEKAEAGFALADLNAPSAGVTTVKHIKHEEKVTERQEEEEEEEAKPPMRAKYEEEEEEQAAPPPPPDDDDDSSSGAGEEEEEEEAKAILTHYANASAAIRNGKSLAACNYTPSRLLRAVKAATGAKTLKAAFGALASLGERVKAAEKTESRIAALEAENNAAKVDGLLTTARRDGKIGGKAHEKQLRADAGKYGPEWLKGHLAAAPKVLRLTDEGFVPRTDADGNLAAAISPDAEKIIAGATAGRPPAEAAALRATILTQHAKTMKGAGGAPSH